MSTTLPFAPSPRPESHLPRPPSSGPFGEPTRLFARMAPQSRLIRRAMDKSLSCTARLHAPRRASLWPMQRLMSGRPLPTVRFCGEPILSTSSLTSFLHWKKKKGLYEQQDEKQIDHNLRGVFVTDAEGKYSFYCLRPTPYPIPMDGPAGKLLKLLDRHEFRPAHIHLIVRVVIEALWIVRLTVRI